MSEPTQKVVDDGRNGEDVISPGVRMIYVPHPLKETQARRRKLLSSKEIPPLELGEIHPY